jgi:transposase InsO family protein
LARPDRADRRFPLIIATSIIEVLQRPIEFTQYSTSAYRAVLREYRLVASMSRKVECLDNAVAESFFGNLKSELTWHCDFEQLG